MHFAPSFLFSYCVLSPPSISLGFLRGAVESLLASCGEWLGSTWDIGHDAGAGFADTPVLREHEDRIAHVHLHDWNGRRSHQVLFSGNVDVSAMLGLAGRRHVGVVIETNRNRDR